MAKKRSAEPAMELAEFHRYLGDQGREIKACYKEVEEVQFQFNDIFKRELEAWQEQFAYCLPRLAAQRAELPTPFAAHVDRVQEEERQRLAQEIADLEKQLTEDRAEMDRLLAEAQQAGESLRQANPELNAEEERLKGLMVRYQDEYARAYEEMEDLASGLFGGITHAVKVGRLKKVQRIAKTRQAETAAQLNKVRKAWAGKLEETGETQATLRSQWQQKSTQVSQAQGRKDHLEANLEALAEQAGLQRVLEELDTPPDVAGELGEGLARLVERNQVRWRYEEGLQAVAEALGLLNGVGEGVKRFARSVQTVLQEQRRYNLKKVDVHVPASVVRINATWQALGEKVIDEKHMGSHPQEFSRLVDAYIKERLTDESIQGYFETLGEALNAATSAWK